MSEEVFDHRDQKKDSLSGLVAVPMIATVFHLLWLIHFTTPSWPVWVVSRVLRSNTGDSAQ